MKKLIIALLVFLITLSLSAQTELSYSYDKPVTYRNTTRIHEVMDVQGQSMDVNVDSKLVCSIRSTAKKGNSVTLEIVVDSMSQVIDSPQGRMGGNSDAGGKKFTIQITPKGRVTDMTGAKNATFNLEGAGTMNFSSEFADFLLVLPEGKNNPGHTWKSTDTLKTDNPTNVQTTIVMADNKLEGFEQVNGLKCVKITSVTEGSSEMRNQVQGMDMKTSGTITGNVVTWIDPVAGILVKQTSSTRLKGQIDITSPENFTMPVVMDIVEVTVIK